VKIVLSLVVRDEADVLEAHIAYHLNAGVDYVLATDHESRDGTSEILESYAREGYLRRIPSSGPGDGAGWRTSMARLAAGELGADWVIDSEADEFWMPRGESLKDVLAPIPPRYGVVQALVRVFPPRPDDGQSFIDRMTVRQAPGSPDDEAMGRLDWSLRPVYRARSDLVIGVARETALDGRVPLRAWYPIEVLRFPLRSLEQAQLRAGGRAGPPEARSRSEHELLQVQRAGTLEDGWTALVIDDDALARGIAAGTLVADERLREALHRLQLAAPTEAGTSRRFALPSGDSGRLGLRAPTVVDDVAYAAECAAVREVDFEPLLARIAELEQRIGTLEARFWPRVLGALSRLVRR
jgi:hypothetical protein